MAERENRHWSVPVDPEFDARVRERMREGGFATLAEYVRSLARADLAAAEQRRLERALTESIDGSHYEPLDDAFISMVRERVEKARRSR